MICPICNKIHDDSVNFCSETGERIFMTGKRKKIRQYAIRKRPVFACILSLLIVGLGQIYIGDYKKGIFMFLCALLFSFFSFGFVWFLFALWSGIDAYQVAKKKLPLWKNIREEI